LTTEVIKIKEAFESIKNEIGKYIVGRESALERLFISLLTGGHVLIEGVPGTAKTYLAKGFATTLGLDFKRIQLTPDLLPSDIIGVTVFNQKTASFEFRKGPIFTNILLADEINRTPPRTQSALLEAMQENQVTIDGITYKLPQPFMVIATENPVESEGVYPLPEAQLDRFLFRIAVSYPAETEEIDILRRKRLLGESLNVNVILQPNDIIKFKNIINNEIKVEEPILQYIISLVRATRENSSIMLGGSTRAAVHLLYAARAHAAISEGRSYVIPDDVKELFIDLMNHRIVLRPEVLIGTYSREPLWSYNLVKRILTEVIESVPVPR
jgi:MoxR-like ATPase